ncbi:MULTISPECIES: hypothetical protein [Brachybacterium]|uniref:Uncharacterized protein n=2 Tax=Brachybacterium TaxID=43668 RepID=A0A426SQI1_9MICO|nr:MULTISPECIES: hypothetical protein [Brachybacterium]MCT1436639.1 hypothetical protein [Brachybacterium paraconglomeratum]RRR20448.1 hypothetical protein DS079_03405 [Brachybacterium paraconglomeratum]GLI32344.1 hypothetical protein BCONGLO52_31850 [Brachybacterium conglomeratum]GLK03877.1 hypothetical protein GCM10017597_06760 [Brachybacterium conglomeratum]
MVDQVTIRLLFSAAAFVVGAALFAFAIWQRRGRSPAARRWMGRGRGNPDFEERMSLIGFPATGVLCWCFSAVVLPVIGVYLILPLAPIAVLCFIPLIICRLDFIPIPDAVYPKWARPIRHANEQAVKDSEAWLRAYRRRQR